MKKHIYVLGTGLSHNGSACLLKDGKIAYAIEKERITRFKHDGFNDSTAIKYCLDAEGITLDDISLVVQNANFGFFEFGNDYYYGDRLFTKEINCPVVTISHHLAHAYNAIGTSPFRDSAILVMDGCGSLMDECIDLSKGLILPEVIQPDLQHIYAEKDSFYNFEANNCKTIYKDFSQFGKFLKDYPMHPGTTLHSIGGIFEAVSVYCFGNHHDEGKLMGLAPFGNPNAYDHEIFDLKNGRVFVRYDWMKHFKTPVRNYNKFYENFQYYADIAAWVQGKVEDAIIYVINSRAKLIDVKNLSYSGGTALNAVANARIIKETPFENVYMTPAAGDNGLSIGCAFYGWLEVLKKERVIHNGNSCFGKTYTNAEIKQSLDSYILPNDNLKNKVVDSFFETLIQVIDKEEYKKENLKLKLQFNIKNAGAFSIDIDGAKCSLIKNFIDSPDCIVNTTSEVIINAPRDEFFSEAFKTAETKTQGDSNVIKKIKFSKDLLKIFDSFNNNIKQNKIQIKYQEEKNIIPLTAKMLAEGKVIGWFNEGCEFGPRALGHRSILADPRRRDIQQFINAKIKFREDFRPFAPSVLLEDVNDYFQLEGESPYMILVSRVNDEWKDKIPGVVHKNNSSRVQTVTPDWNKNFYDLLQEFKKITGISVLLNTSFNKRGMPIVETPMDAISFFYECSLDALVMGNYVISKTDDAL